MFEDIISEYKNRFQENGHFDYERDGNLKGTIKANVPDKPGVYIISGIVDSTKKIFYIGKAGTMKRGGSFSDQKLPDRLKAKQRWKGKNVSRRQFFNDRMRELKIERIEFIWFVTFDSNVRILPVKAESDFFQEYYDEFKELPAWNNTI